MPHPDTLCREEVEIPDDIMKIARQVVKDNFNLAKIIDPDGYALIIARALQAQRERDAKIAEKHFDLRHADKARFASMSIASAIRKGASDHA